MLQQENTFPVPDETIDQNTTYLHFLGPTPDSTGELKTLEISIQLIMPCYTKTNKNNKKHSSLILQVVTLFPDVSLHFHRASLLI